MPEVDFAQLVKLFGDYGQHDTAGRYSPSPIVEVISKVRDGNPDPRTSHFARRAPEPHDADGDSQVYAADERFHKKLENLKRRRAALRLLQLLPRHSSLRVTPAMEAGLTDHVWTVAELLKPEHIQ